MMRFFLLFIAASTLAVAAWVGSIGYDAFFVSPASDAQAVSFRVEPGWSVKQTAVSLEQNQLIKSAFPFELFVKATGTDGAFKAGTFQLKPDMSYAAIVAALTISTKGEEVSVTIPEGYTAAQIGDAVRAVLPNITKAEWDAVTGKNSPLLSDPMLATVPKGQGLEGYLFPDTYEFRPDATAEDVAGKMVQTLARRLAENGITPDADFHKTLTLASIVEREVKQPEDMKLVADIFDKRMKAGMALQADSTVNYAVHGTSPGISYADMQVDSPYNTYKYPGLPPGPISNPGMNAILAAVHPEANPYFYFLTTPDGSVKYARTFDEHVENRALYLH